jgi:hypothetical protein
MKHPDYMRSWKYYPLFSWQNCGKFIFMHWHSSKKIFYGYFPQPRDEHQYAFLQQEFTKSIWYGYPWALKESILGQKY